MLSIQFDTTAIARASNLFHAAGKNAPLALVRAVNHTGDKARTQMRRVLVKQTGLTMKTIRKAVTSKQAWDGSPYEIKSRGGNIRLKYFKARETRKGVTAAPWGKRQIYPHTFIKGGLFTDAKQRRAWHPLLTALGRKPLNMGGHVFIRLGKRKLPIEAVKSGLFIPTEMVSGSSEAAFNATVERELPARIAHELFRVLG